MRIWLPQPKDADFATIAVLPWLVPTESLQDMIDKLRTRLRRKTTFCEIAVENERTQAMLIAYVTDDNSQVWLWQAHARAGFRFSRLMFNGLVSWTWAQGISEIRLSATDERHRKLYERRYGFVRDGKEMRKDVA